MKTLLEIAAPLKTDKFTEHCYAQTYEGLFAPIRYQSIRLLEIGVGTGDCLRMWEEYFPNGEIWGCDIAIPEYLTNRFMLLDSTYKPDVERAFAGRQFDIIIDDANHDPRYQLSTYANFMPHLKPGGIYVVEDVPGPLTTAEMFRQQDPQHPIQVIDLRAMRGRWDDALLVIRG